MSLYQLNADTTSFSENIRINQIGYFVKGLKKAVAIDFTETTFEIWTSDLAKKVFAGTLSKRAQWISSGEDNIQIADFSTFKKEGSYVVVIGNKKSYPFTISQTVLEEVTKAQMKFYYFNRCSYELLPKYAGKWARKAGHLHSDVGVFDDRSRKIAMPGGWYDAGDYGLYMVTGSIAACEMMMSYEQCSEYWNKTEWNIPESSNGVPDILDEVKYELKWMYKMKDDDNGVWYKATSIRHAAFVMPDKDTSTFYCMVKSATAAYDYAATFAIAARVFKKFTKQYPGFSDSCLTVAKLAWTWAVNNETTYPSCKSPMGVRTGNYPDSLSQNGKDNKVLAGTELFITTGDSSYVKPILHEAQTGYNSGYCEPNWTEKRPLATIELAFRGDTKAKENVLKKAEAEMRYIDSSSYNVNIGKDPKEFDWGSNRRVSERAIALSAAYILTKDKLYLQGVTNALDYVLGRNALGYCFITGFGSKRVINPHHRVSGSDGIEEPVPGLPIQGPYFGSVGKFCTPLVISPFAAKNYYDNECSFVTNEECIDEGSAHIFNLATVMQYYSKK